MEQAKRYPTIKVGNEIKCGGIHVAYEVSHSIHEDGWLTRIEQRPDAWYVVVTKEDRRVFNGTKARNNSKD